MFFLTAWSLSEDILTESQCGFSTSPDIKIHGTTLEVVEHFPYLGSHLSQKATVEAEIQHRICCASTSLKNLRNRVFDNNVLRRDTKVMIYKAICITTLLYGSEAWVTYRCHLKTLEKFYQRCLRTLLCIRWENRRTNISILMEANATSIEAMVIQNQLRWAGHCIRMSENRLPRQVFCTQLIHNMRTRGGQRKRFKDTAKYYKKKGQIDINVWERIAADRPL